MSYKKDIIRPVDQKIEIGDMVEFTDFSGTVYYFGIEKDRAYRVVNKDGTYVKLEDMARWWHISRLKKVTYGD